MTTPNPQRGEEKLVLGDLELTLSPEFEKLAQLEAALGRSVVSLVRQVESDQDVTLTDLASAVYLLAKGKRPEQREIGRRIVAHGFEPAVTAVYRVLARGLLGTASGEDLDEAPDPGKAPSAE